MLKYFANSVEKVQEILNKKIRMELEEVNKPEYASSKYIELLKKNLTKLFADYDEYISLEKEIVLSEAKQRPETAQPGQGRNYKKMNSNISSISVGKNNHDGTFMSFSGRRASLTTPKHFPTPPADSFTNSPTFNHAITPGIKFSSIELNPGEKPLIPSPNVKQIEREGRNSIQFLNNQKSNLSLTKFVWPKSRTLLSIISKMYAESYINAEQRGVLKELIMDYDKNILSILAEYEVNGNSYEMYQSIINLANS
jgi:hypothetical protein